MNRLQPLATRDPFIVSIDYDGPLDPAKIQWSQTYHHPSFTPEAMRAQRDLPALNRNSRLLFCGSYFRYGFHEDAHVSGLQVVHELKQRIGSHHEVLPL
jgi:predicted NAD/FAD-binding protein